MEDSLSATLKTSVARGFDGSTVTDPQTGLSVRASTENEGPENFSLTWGAISALIKLHVGFAIPIHRISLMLGTRAFSSGKICRVLQFVAGQILPIYLALAEQLADSSVLSGDDTSTKVLEFNLPVTTRDGPRLSLSEKIEDELGFRFPRSDGKGEKKKVNVSFLMGKTQTSDPASTVCFFRTHVGSVGNLLGRLLATRAPKHGPVWFQGDLSTTNLPPSEIREAVKIIVCGCGAHARRPFWRYREQDPDLCFYMLRGFADLALIEDRIDQEGRTTEHTLFLREKFGRKIWTALRNRCEAAISGRPPTKTCIPDAESDPPRFWPPKSVLHDAARYVIENFEALTRYLGDARIDYTNNARERALRQEKCMLVTSKFRKTKNGRATLDILRTIHATCITAQVELTDYIRWVYKNRHDIEATPENFTPYAFRKQLHPA
jgi:Transposase IS66 family